MLLTTATVLSNDRLADEYRVLVLLAPAIARQVKPGQFVHLRVPRLAEAVLRRPFSVFKAEGGRLALLYKCIGRGTRAMALLHPGDKVSLLGPLGQGFPPIRRGRQPVLVAGGYGMAALYLLARQAPVKGDVFVGGAGANDILCVSDFRKLGWRVHVATEDGSRGAQGLVTLILDRWLRRPTGKQQLEFFACGPMGMLRVVGDRAQAGGWNAWLSLDRHMGCGVGACLACVQKVKQRSPAARSPAETEIGAAWKWARICTEGPVFECREIVWE
jgi:dihydroorotate dehydrogenase electron transfer subunit